MTFVSYAQNYEDLILWRALKTVNGGTYIDLGAAWPNFHSVTKAFYDSGWSGINVEPNPALLKELNRERLRDTNLGVIIGDSEGEATLKVMSNAGLSTVSDDIAKGHVERGFDQQDIVAPMMTLRSLCETYLDDEAQIHFLKIDVEGHEAQALRGNDWTTFRPWIVAVEATEPMSQVTNHHLWEHYLTEADYTLVYRDGLNRYYLAKEHHDDLAPAFTYPPNLFDDYMSVEQQQAMIKVGQLQAQCDELQQQKQSLEAQNAEISQELLQLQQRIDGDEAYKASRRLIDDLLFRTNGEPRKFTKALFFHTSGRIRGGLRHLVLLRDGRPRRRFRQWMKSEAYNALPQAYFDPK